MDGEDGEFERCNGTPAFLAPEMMKPQARYRCSTGQCSAVHEQCGRVGRHLGCGKQTAMSLCARPVTAHWQQMLTRCIFGAPVAT